MSDGDKGQVNNRRDGRFKKAMVWWQSRPWWPGAAHWASLLLIGAAVWGIINSMLEGSFVAGSQLFSLMTLFIAAFLGGQLTSLMQLPALLGMLLTGILLRNVGFIEISSDYQHVTAILREMALCVILTRAGLGLDPTALRSLSTMIVRLAVVPSLVEGFFTTIMTHYLLGLPWLWGILLAAILAAVSPAVVIPCLFSLQERGYGTTKGIPTLIVAAASFDDILAISVFGVILGIIFSTGDLTNTIIQGPLGVIIGIAFGIVWGAIATQIPHKNDPNVVLLRSLMVGCGGLVAILGSEFLGYQGAGPLGCIVLAFVACYGWRKQGWNGKTNPVGDVFQVIWALFQPVLFGLIGTEVNISVLEGSVVGYGILSLLVAIFGRIVISIFIAFGADFTWKEKTFVAWAWFPKATVQAALGPLALDIARQQGTPEEIQYASYILIVAVLAILLTAPIGAVLITLLGPRLLTKEEPVVTTPQEVTNQETVLTSEIES